MSVSEKDASVAVLPAQVEYFIDKDEDRAVLRKIDWIVMPTMMMVLFFQCRISHPPNSTRYRDADSFV